MATDYYGTTREQCLAGLQQKDEDTRCEALAFIADLGDNGAAHLQLLAPVCQVLSDPSLKVKCAALTCLGCMGQVAAPAVSKVAGHLSASDVDVRHAAIEALGRIGVHAAPHAWELLALLHDESLGIRAAVATALGLMRSPHGLEGLVACLKDPEPCVSSSALHSIGAMGPDGRSLAGAVAECLTRSCRNHRAQAIWTLTQLGDAALPHAGAVAGLLADLDNMVREAAVEFFMSFGKGASAATDKVSKFLTHKDGRVQAAAAIALGHLEAKELAWDIAKLLQSKYVDESSVALYAAGVEPKLSVPLRRTRCAAAVALAALEADGSPFVALIVEGIDAGPAEASACLTRALGSMGSGAAVYVPKLTSMLSDSSGPVRAAACKALGDLAQHTETSSASTAVAARLQDEHPLVRQDAVRALGCMPSEGPQFADAVAALLRDRVSKVQVAAAEALGCFGLRGQVYAAEVCKLLEADASVRCAAAVVLASMGERGAAFAEEVAELLGDAAGPVRVAGLEALAAMGEDAMPFLPLISELAARDPLDYVREAAEESVKRLQ